MGILYLYQTSQIYPEVFLFDCFPDDIGWEKSSHFMNECLSNLRNIPCFAHTVVQKNQKISNCSPMILHFSGDKFKGELAILLFEPADIPKITVLNSVRSQGQGHHLVGKNFFPALCLDYEPRSSHLHTIEVAQQHGLFVVTGNGTDIDMNEFFA